MSRKKIRPRNPYVAPAKQRNSADRERSRRRRQQALSHPAVNTAIEILSGEIVDIHPLGGEP